jgi:hypothetical protein
MNDLNFTTPAFRPPLLIKEGIGVLAYGEDNVEDFLGLLAVIIIV